MGIQAIPVSQTTLDGLQAALGDDGVTVESLEVSGEERANGLIGRYRCRSEQGGIVILCFQSYDRYPPFEIVCTVQFGEGFSFSRKHHKLYWRVVDRLEEIAKNEEQQG